MENKKGKIKAAVGIAVSVGVSAIVGGIIKSNVDTEDTGFVKRACIGLGALVLGGIVSEYAVNYTDAKIEGFAAGIESGKEKVEEVKTEEEKQE